MGLNAALGNDPKELPSLLELDEQAIVEEFESHGTEADKANLRHILHGTACEEPLPDHVRDQLKSCLLYTSPSPRD